MLKITVEVDDDFNFRDAVDVAEGKEVRGHDIAFILSRVVAKMQALGSSRLLTVAEVARYNAVLAEWDETLDGVSIVNGAHMRSWKRKESDAEPVMAPCNADGGANIATAKALESVMQAEAK